jgi:hypothetical protein
VNLVDEQQGRLAQRAAALCGLEHLLQVGDAGEHRRYLRERQAGGPGQQPRDRGFPHSRGPP